MQINSQPEASRLWLACTEQWGSWDGCRTLWLAASPLVYFHLLSLLLNKLLCNQHIKATTSKMKDSFLRNSRFYFSDTSWLHESYERKLTMALPVPKLANELRGMKMYCYGGDWGLLPFLALWTASYSRQAQWLQSSRTVLSSAVCMLCSDNCVNQTHINMYMYYEYDLLNYITAAKQSLLLLCRPSSPPVLFSV